MERIPQELKEFFLKIIIPAVVAISIKLAMESRNEKISFFNALTSVIIGVGCAYLASGWVMDSFKDNTIPLIIACITIVGEKISYWLIYKFKFDVLGDAIINYLIDKYRPKK